LPIAALIHLWLERQPAKYAMTFTNMDVLVAVAGGRSLRRYIPPAPRCWRWRRASRSPARTAPPWSPDRATVVLDRRLQLDARDRRETLALAAARTRCVPS
jgi:hypothetical protein